MAGGVEAWVLGRLMQNLRNASGMNRVQAGSFVNVSDTTLARMEHGGLVKSFNGPTLEFLARHYKATEKQIEAVLGLYRQAIAAKSRSGGAWWSAYADTYHSQFDYYLSLEDAAVELTIFQLTLIPGLFQTSEYRRAAIQSAQKVARPPGEVERRIELLARRQARLTEGPDLTVDVIISEMALHAPLAPPDVMRAQLHSLVDIGHLPNVSLRVIPRSVFGYPGLVVGSFTICEFPKLEGIDLARPPVVYVEGYEGALFLEDEVGTARYQGVTQVHSGVALSTEDSRSLILEIAEN